MQSGEQRTAKRVGNIADPLDFMHWSGANQRIWSIPDPLATPAPLRPVGLVSSIESQPRLRAVTTACVRSLTASLRRIEVMWFFTV